MSHEHTGDLLREALKSYSGITEKRMFGGICFMMNGNMLCGTGDGRFMFRVGKDREAEALKRPGAVPMDFTGRKMGGLIWVDQEAATESGLEDWIEFTKVFVGSLPVK